MVQLTKGDITKIKADAIVNAANSSLMGGGGVDGAIHRAAGVQLLEECRRIKKVGGLRCPIGEARITKGFNLPAKWVIHTVGPRYHYSKDPAKLLKEAYRSSLNLAIKNDISSIVFPAISCGVFSYPLEEAALISLEECLMAEYDSLYITFCLYQDEAFKVFQKVLADLNRR